MMRAQAIGAYDRIDAGDWQLSQSQGARAS